MAGQIVPMSTVDTVEMGPTTFLVVSTPHALHHAWIVQRGRGALWTVSLDSVQRPLKPYQYATYESALRSATDMVARVAGRDLARMTKGQTDALGGSLCPYRLPVGVCRTPRVAQTPQGAPSVWCAWHPKGEESAHA